MHRRVAQSSSRWPFACGISLLGVWILLAHRGIGVALLHAVASFPSPLWWLAAATIASLLVPGVGRVFARAIVAPPTWAFLGVATASSVASTAWLYFGPNRGLPLSLDAAVYTFEARGLAHLHFGAPIPPPRLPFGMRFLFEGADGRMHGVFAPGFPLYLAPFLAIGAPVLALLVVSGSLVLSQHALALEVTRSRFVARLSILLALPSFVRTAETAEAFAHAFVTVLAAVAVTLTLRHARRPRWTSALGAGACVGWVFCARELDGAVLGVIALALLLGAVVRRRSPARLLVVAAVGALPFVALLAAQHEVVTGSFFRPMQVEYAARADFPVDCARLGLGRTIGCSIEHPREVAAFGPDGYGIDDALRVASERAGALGDDLFGFGPLVLLAFVPLVRRPRGSELACGAFAVALALAYATFYYGNAPIFGARHLFPAAPFLWILAARALASPSPGRVRRSFGTVRVRGAISAGVLAAVGAAAFPAWRAGVEATRAAQSGRVDLRALVEREHLERGIVATGDFLSVIAATDPWTDRRDRFFVFDSPFGFHDLRLLRPDLPVFFAAPSGQLAPFAVPPAPPGVHIELERAWPSFQRVSGLGAHMLHATGLYGLPASGEHVLHLFAARPGASLSIPLWIVEEGTYLLRVDGLAGPDYGDYELALDGEPLGRFPGYAPSRELRPGPVSGPRLLTRGPHLFEARCVGRAPESTGYDAALDAFVGVRVDR